MTTLNFQELHRIKVKKARLKTDILSTRYNLKNVNYKVDRFLRDMKFKQYEVILLLTIFKVWSCL